MGGLFLVPGDDFMSRTEYLDATVVKPHADLAHPANISHSTDALAPAFWWGY